MNTLARPEDNFDWAKPDYAPVFRARCDRLTWLRSGTNKERAQKLADVNAHYRTHPVDWIRDWCVTSDSRNAEINQPVVMPFIPWPKQCEFIETVYEQWRARKGLLVEKSRDQGISWLAMAFSVWLCLYHADVCVGVGSRKLELVDGKGDPKTLFFKARQILAYLPAEFIPGWSMQKYSRENALHFPNGSSIIGEGGDKIGRGARTSIYFVDEAAHLERPGEIDAALAATTNCRVDMSSVSGMDNSFAIRRHSGKMRVLTMHWQTDPRKPPDFMERMIEAGHDPVMLEQEFGISYVGLKDGQIIPARLVSAAVDAHIKLGLKPSGDRRSSFDVADQGKDKCAWGVAHGWLLEYAEEWSGAGKDILDSVYRVFDLCDRHRVPNVVYDATGMGAPSVEPNARTANKARTDAKRKPVPVIPYMSGGPVLWPEQRTPGAMDRRNEDMFSNFGAQAMWALKRRFEETERALQGKPYDPEGIISIAGPLTYKAWGKEDAFKGRGKLMVELSQPCWKLTETGKLKVDKVPDGASSPNLADMARMLFAPRNVGLQIREGAAEALLRGG